MSDLSVQNQFKVKCYLILRFGGKSSDYIKTKAVNPAEMIKTKNIL